MKTELVRIRCLPTEKTAWENASGRKNFSAWARAHLNEAARNQGAQPTLIPPAEDQDDYSSWV